jgi:hypothetical protein
MIRSPLKNMTAEQKHPEKVPIKQQNTNNTGSSKPQLHPTRQPAPLQRQIQPNLTTQNRFSSLSDTEKTFDEIPKNPRKRVCRSPSASLTPVQHRRQHQQRRSTTDKAAKPIFITNTNFKIIHTLVTSLKLTKAPTILKRRGNDFAVTAFTIDDKKALIAKLKSQQLQHFTFTENEDRHLMFVLLGHHEAPTEDLLDELKRNSIPAIKVSKINASAENPIFLVSFDKNSVTLSDLQFQHNILDGLKIRWDRHKPKSRRPTQCKRCQRFGHAAVNCQLPYRCMKCCITHEPGKCARTNRDEGKPACVNCGKEGHTTNSPNCTVYQSYVEKINAIKKTPAERQPRTFPATRHNWNKQPSSLNIAAANWTNNNKNFPSIASQSATTSTSNPNNVTNNREYRQSLSQNPLLTQNMPQNPFSQLSDLQAELFSIPDFQETLNLFANLVKEMKATKNHGERISILLKHTGLLTKFSSSQQ